MKISIRCDQCSNSDKIEDHVVKRLLREDHDYAYGDHVSDPRAFAMRFQSIRNWKYTGVPMGKSTVTMTCPNHRERPYEADEDPAVAYAAVTT